MYDFYDNNYEDGLLHVDQDMEWFIDEKYAFMFTYDFTQNEEQKKDYKIRLEEYAGSLTEVYRHIIIGETL